MFWNPTSSYEKQSQKFRVFERHFERGVYYVNFLFYIFGQKTNLKCHHGAENSRISNQPFCYQPPLEVLRIMYIDEDFSHTQLQKCIWDCSLIVEDTRISFDLCRFIFEVIL